MSWAIALIGFMLLIVLHELGHFLAAKAVGMRVERFSLFFPPTIFSVRRGETEYGIGAIPLGGYVKITGMSPQEIDELEPEVAKRAYYNQAPWKRIVVILAGPGVNLVIAFALFWAILASNSLNGAYTLESLNPSIQTVIPSVASVEKGSPAEGALHAGDRILAIGGRSASLNSIVDGVSSHRCAGAQVNDCLAATPVQLTVRRDGRDQTLSVRPRYSMKEKRMLIGFHFGLAPKPIGVFAAAGVAAHEMWATTTSLFTNLGKAFTSAKVRHQFHSVIGITEIAHETVVAGAGYALVFAGFISLILAVLNLLPFLPLDGGHILWSLGEKVRGRRISLAAMYRYSTVGILLLAFLVINGISNDIGHLGG
ncbi:MAG TPA: M50 family metallopeptidase [Solirubrobacteraceae bacterium]|jgi:regulator of sigma E protease|nr:M50 family metallopeptidase [Solirubrobacteraceae bacterium]